MKKFISDRNKFSKITTNHKKGQLSKNDIINELNSDNGLKIRLGINEDDIVKKIICSASYDITPSIVAMSSKIGMLETVYKTSSKLENSYYIYVKPKDTVMIVSNEFICLPPNMAGYVTSRVSNVVRGFGHISTTIDPSWNGALLIALSNPSNHAIRINVGISTLKKENDEYKVIDSQNTLATLTFHYLHSSIADVNQKYKSMRIDLLESIKYDKKCGIKAAFRKVFHFKRRRYTDYFFEYLQIHGNEMLTESGWSEFLDEFSKVVKNNNNDNNFSVTNFVIKENIFRRAIRFIIEHRLSFTLLLIIFLLILFRFNLISTDIIQFILQLL